MKKKLPAAVLFSILCSTAFGQNLDSLRAGFKDPPMSAWPRTWWHWTKSNVTKEGITKDLEWMKRSGIVGFQLADVNSGSGQTVKDTIVFGSPQWLDAVQYAAAEADRLGLEMAIFSSAGWSLTGGPWVKPAQAMKKLVWSVTSAEGAKPFTGKLPTPPSGEGPGPLLANNNERSKGFYQDVAVIAFPAPADETDNNQPQVTSSNGNEDAGKLMDNDLMTTINVQSGGPGQQAWVQLSYQQPFQAKAITIAGRRGIPFGRVLASEDGVHFSTLVAIPGKSGYRGGNIRTYTFPACTAKYYRIECTNVPPRPADVISEATTADTTYTFSEIQLHTGARINRWEDKAGFNFLFEYSGVATLATSKASAIDPASVIDLTSKMNADGTLTWTPPGGKWTIMRFGYALTGAKNRPAVPAGLGYEVDKMNPQHVTEYMKGYTGPLMKSLGDLYGKRLQYFMLDSWEAGIQNWTDILPTEFKKRRGYEIIPYLPALAGRVIGDGNISDRFLWDFRRTLVDMIAENHYGVVTNFLHKQGIKTYGEAGGVSLESIEDALLNKKYVDIPMGEFWVRDLHPSSMYYEDVRGAASASHVYGQNLVAAEAFTGGNYESPQTLKNIADYWFTQGVNRLVFHTSAHQPLDTKPGNVMVGTHLHRNITWAEHVKPLTTYFARNSFMLQQGRYVADIAYLLNEGAPATMPFWGGGLQPATPKGYQFDYINADVLLNLMSVDQQGKLVLPDGMQYAILVLPQTEQMSLPVLKKIKELVAGGAIVVGPKPEQSPSLASPDSAIKELAAELWGDLDGVSRTRRTYGKGKLVWGIPLDEVLTKARITKDVDLNYGNDKLAWIHRRDGNTEIYYLVNRTNTPIAVTGRFNVAGKDVELWRSDGGVMEKASYSIDSMATRVDVPLLEHEAVFVVFGNKASQVAHTAPQKQYTFLSEVKGAWDVSFPKDLGAPATIQLPQLISLTENKEEGVRYFSGTCTYTKVMNIKKEWLTPKQKIILDLGAVKDMAEVYINGNRVDFLWKSPFLVDITKVVKPGNNKLEIKITNEWTNRLAGDRDHPEHKVLSSYPMPFGIRGYELSSSGLLGPVRLVSCKP
jgi:hypothetical protein